MKKPILILTILLLALFTLPTFAEPITADTVAVSAWSWTSILHEIVYPALVTGLLSLMAWITTTGVKLLNAWLKQVMHFKGASVVADAITEVLAIMGAEITKAIADGKITAEEKAAIKAKAKELAISRLKRLSGFYKNDLISWVDEQVEIGLGKLLLKAGLKTN